MEAIDGKISLVTEIISILLDILIHPNLCAGSGRGKRGGIRTIYFYHAGLGAIYLLTAYAKADRDDLNPADKKALSRLVAVIKKEGTKN